MWKSAKPEDQSLLATFHMTCKVRGLVLRIALRNHAIETGLTLASGSRSRHNSMYFITAKVNSFGIQDVYCTVSPNIRSTLPLQTKSVDRHYC